MRRGKPVVSLGCYMFWNGKLFIFEEEDIRPVIELSLAGGDPSELPETIGSMKRVLRFNQYMSRHSSSRTDADQYHMISRLFEITDDASSKEAWSNRRYFDEARLLLYNLTAFDDLLLDAAGKLITTKFRAVK